MSKQPLVIRRIKDINRMNFVIDGKVVSRDLITKLCKEYNSLLPKSEDESKNYRPFARAVFKKMFELNKVRVPGNLILD
ncbi:hypothetical protein [Wolbachia endosymbiont of Mansonella perstans]|uniref:hypothetical protein n=1 Tax=Wolbachia endosymbiont of Mansonella perstans TaxID=229526 RepID=UPI001CE1B964|nr:hypothetical protein [Wolbachia endosymbiont of Mansonella perstans]MCA4774307.1 hypothetical protein [Wolbachia endosymbiont of Mansonella perstans]